MTLNDLVSDQFLDQTSNPPLDLGGGPVLRVLQLQRLLPLHLPERHDAAGLHLGLGQHVGHQGGGKNKSYGLISCKICLEIIPGVFCIFWCKLFNILVQGIPILVKTLVHVL